MPLLRRVARVAAVGAVAGGASGAVQHRQQGRWARQEEEKAAASQEQQQTAAAARPPENSIEKLKELGQLHESGVLTDEEFATAKTKILNI
ncbi:MAG TPA: SHOCT domain-containing protein [Solirubrobacteraceae bacterium]|nr:SHOCT domain-containing protein [Solirubrobacteraceae bacterium]